MGQQSENRNAVVDILRGIAAIAVLAGHAVQRGSSYSNIDYSQLFIWKFIYAWHMPLFVLLSGFTLYITRNRVNLIVKFKRLVVPTFVWSILLFFLHDLEFVGIHWYRNFPEQIGEFLLILLKDPTWIIWFLWVIFIYTVTLVLARKLTEMTFPSEDNILVVLAVSFILFQLITMIQTPYFGMNYIRGYYIYFLIGYLIGNLSEKGEVRNLIALSTVLFLTVYLFGKRYGIVHNSVTDLAKTFLAMGAIYLFVKWLVVQLKVEKKFIGKIVIWMGNCSLYLYLCQIVCLNIGIGTGSIRMLVIFFTATGISCLMTILIKKIKIADALLFGRF